MKKRICSVLDLAGKAWTFILIPLYFGVLCLSLVVVCCMMGYEILTGKERLDDSEE